MPFLSGKQAFLEILVQEGAECMFGNPGTTELPLMDGLARESRIRYILALQESVAVAMADGYAQAGGRPPGGEAHPPPRAGAPPRGVSQPRLEDLPRAVRRAAKTAFAHPAGPVFLSIPVDVLNAEREIDLLAPTRIAPRIRGDAAAVEAAADLLVSAKSPILISGDAVAHGDALVEMAEVAELLGAPVYAECVPSTCSFPFTHPLYRGAFPRLGVPIRTLLMQHDLVFSVGGDLFTLSLPPDVEPMPEGLPVIHLDTDPWEIGKNYPARGAILGEPQATLPA